MAFYGVIKKSEIAKKEESMEKEGRYWLDLIPWQENENFICKIVKVENSKIQPALHRRDHDIYHVLEGTAKFTFKGELVNPHKIENECDPETVRGNGIKGGETFEIAEGDLVSIPKNTPHTVDATNSKIVFLTIKVNAGE